MDRDGIREEGGNEIKVHKGKRGGIKGAISEEKGRRHCWLNFNILFKNSVRTSKRTPYFTITKINWLTLFKFNPLKPKLV
jgi:hypothetical protein